MQNHTTNYSKFLKNEEPITRTFRMSQADWKRLHNIRDELLASHGIKLSMNATFIHLLHLHGQKSAADATRQTNNEGRWLIGGCAE